MKLLVEFEYNDKNLGRDWFNIYNLELCLFGKAFTKRNLLKVKEIKEKEKGEEADEKD